MSLFLATYKALKFASLVFKMAQLNCKTALLLFLMRHCQATPGDEHQVGLDYKDLPKDLIAGDVLLLDDGRMRFNR